VRIFETKADLRAALEPERRASRSIGLVPTMGHLHEGHLSLVRTARERCEIVVLSVFVNPAQFGPGEDLEGYPRDPERDARLAERAGVDLLYAPTVSEVYPEGFQTAVEVEGLTEVLCGDRGRRGPEHFRGVTTVVAKLFNSVGPDVAFFGQKDAQQAIVIGRMVREPDGLALSSRNTYLEPAERRRAPALSRALEAARATAQAGRGDLDAALGAARAVLAEAGIEPEYLEARNADDLSPADGFNGRPVLVAVAAPLGRARLIDNVVIEPPRRNEAGRSG
jgi:pantoate--beta-alanine ligase